MSQLSLGITLPVINEAFNLLNESPISSKKRSNEIYLKSKIKNVARNLTKSLGVGDYSNSHHKFCDSDAEDIISRLKEKFHDEHTSNWEKIQILTLMPSSWSNNKIIEVMGATMYMTKKARKLVAEEGVLSVPAQKIG